MSLDDVYDELVQVNNELDNISSELGNINNYLGADLVVSLQEIVEGLSEQERILATILAIEGVRAGLIKIEHEELAQSLKALLEEMGLKVEILSGT